ncbi:amidophosphoribosyltransferase [Trichonephila clavipes]|nr:amidophosphoribosyltransferase [Trichonephila clavipes]
MERGVGLSTESDSELMIQTLCLAPPEPNNETDEYPDWPARIKNLMRRTKTAYSLLVMSGDTIYAVRDPYGLRPLCLGKLIPPRGSLGPLDNDSECDGYVVSSESCAFPSVSGRLLREVEPGEIVEITKNGIRSVCIVPRPDNDRPALCIFEYVYFARPDTVMEVYSVTSHLSQLSAALLFPVTPGKKARRKFAPKEQMEFGAESKEAVCKPVFFPIRNRRGVRQTCRKGLKRRIGK